MELDETQPMAAPEDVGQPPAHEPEAYDQPEMEASSASEMPPPGVEGDAGDPADDQLAMFGVVAPGDPEPVAVRRPRKKKIEGAGRGAAGQGEAPAPRARAYSYTVST